MSAELIASFQAITGLSDETKCRKFITAANGNLELALSNYFDSGAIPPEDLHPSVFQPPPQIQQDDMQIEFEEPEEVPEPLEVAPALYPSQAVDKPLPLQGISIKAQVLNFIANIELAQRFVNDGKNPIEAVFQFQQYDSALHGFDVEVDGKIYKGKIKSKQKALEDYDDTIASGHGAYLLEKDKTRDDVYRINVGNLPPGKEATLRIYYLTELETEGDSLRLVLPATRTKVYSKSGEKSAQSDATHTLQGLSVHLDLEMNHELVEITSPTHQIETKLDGKKGALDLKPNQEQRGRAMVVLIKLANPHAPMVTIEKYKSAQSTAANNEKKRPAVEVEREEKRLKQDAVTVSLFPKVEIQDDPVCEIIFLVDRSGSMAGSRMNQTKNALQIFLRSLPVGTKFNIVGFGDTYEKLFPSSVFFDDRSLNTATNHVLNMQSNLIGTNILPPLRDILTREADPEFPRQVFCLTDGEVKNTEEVLEFVKNNARGCRVFTFGIGADASKALVLGIAKYGHGKAEFIRSGERIEPVVMRQLKRALQPVLRDVNVHWGSLPVAERKAEYDIPPIFDGDKLVVSTFLDPTAQTNNAPEQPPAKNEVTIKAKSGNESFEWRAEFDSQQTIEGELTHKLCAMKLIRDYEKNKAQNLKKEIADLGAVWGLVSSQTSYIAVELRKDATEGNMEPMDVTDALRTFGAENSEQIQVEAVQQSSRRLSYVAASSSEGNRYIDRMDLDEPAPKKHAELAKNKSSSGPGIFGKIGSWLKGESKEKSDGSAKRKRSSRKAEAPIEDKYQYYRDESAVQADNSSDEDDVSEDDRENEAQYAEDNQYPEERRDQDDFVQRPSQSTILDAAPSYQQPTSSSSSISYAQPQKPMGQIQPVVQPTSTPNYQQQPSNLFELLPVPTPMDDGTKFTVGGAYIPEPVSPSSATKSRDVTASSLSRSKSKEKNSIEPPKKLVEAKKGAKDKDNKDKEPKGKKEEKEGTKDKGNKKDKEPKDKKAKLSDSKKNKKDGAGAGGQEEMMISGGSSPRRGPPPPPQGAPDMPPGPPPQEPPSFVPSPKRPAGEPGAAKTFGAPLSPRYIPSAPRQAPMPGRGSSSGPNPNFINTPSAPPSNFSQAPKLAQKTGAVEDPVIKQITSAQRPLDRIVLAQAANGSFVIEHIAAALGVDVTRVKQALPALLAALENSLLLWATAVALSYLEHREANSRDEWDLIGGKAKKYLTRTLTATPQLVEQILEEAKKFVATL